MESPSLTRRLAPLIGAAGAALALLATLALIAALGLILGLAVALGLGAGAPLAASLGRRSLDALDARRTPARYSPSVAVRRAHVGRHRREPGTYVLVA